MVRTVTVLVIACPHALGLAVPLVINLSTALSDRTGILVLASSDPWGVISVIRLCRTSYRKMLQNLGWAAGYDVVAIPLAAGALTLRPSPAP